MSRLDEALSGVIWLAGFCAAVVVSFFLWILVFAAYADYVGLSENAVLVANVVTGIIGPVMIFALTWRITQEQRWAVAILTVGLCLLTIWPMVAFMGGFVGPLPDANADITGRVSSDYLLAAGDGQSSHEIALERGDTVRITFDVESGAVHWRIVLPDGEVLTSSDSIDRQDTVTRTDDGDIVYRVNQTGAHRISISTEPYTRAAYSVHIEESG